MPTPPTAVPISVLPDAQKQKQLEQEIDHTIDAPGKLRTTIEEFQKEILNAETELTKSIANDLAAAPLNVDPAIAKLEAYKSKRKTLEAKIDDCKELLIIITARIEELEQTQPETLRSVVEAKLDQLEKQVLAETETEAQLQEQITALEDLLKHLKSNAAKTTS
jgi:chromosome segregation ATPase